MKYIKSSVVAMAGLVLATATSHASLTPINLPWGTSGGGGEWNLTYNPAGGNVATDQNSSAMGIMEYVYGNFTRVSDPGDSIWGGTSGSVLFTSIYSADGQSLTTTGLSGSPQSPVIVQGGGSTGTTPSRTGSTITTFNTVANPFLFQDTPAGGIIASSDPSLNPNDFDGMVTFAVTGYMTDPGQADNTWQPFQDGSTHYVIAFEDSNKNGDTDYNDFVVEVAGVSPVPEPTTIVAGVLLLLPLGASALRGFRKNRNV